LALGPLCPLYFKGDLSPNSSSPFVPDGSMFVMMMSWDPKTTTNCHALFLTTCPKLMLFISRNGEPVECHWRNSQCFKCPQAARPFWPQKRMESRIKRIIIKTKKGPRKYMKNGIPALSVCVGKSQFPISLESFFLFLLLQKKEEKETKRCISLIGSLGYHNFPKRLFIWSYAGILEMRFTLSEGC
jgi:hypothetical protein